MKVQVRGALCVAMLCLASVGFAQQDTYQSGTSNTGTIVSGSIVSVSNDVIVVRTDSGETMRFNRDASVNVPSNLMAGNRVSVEYNWLAADNMRLTRIALDDNTGASGTTRLDGSRSTTTTTTSGTTTGDRATASGTTGNNTYNSTTGNNTTGYARLPQTASPLVMMAFAGLVALGGALALRARRRS